MIISTITTVKPITKNNFLSLIATAAIVDIMMIMMQFITTIICRLLLLVTGVQITSIIIRIITGLHLTIIRTIIITRITAITTIVTQAIRTIMVIQDTMVAFIIRIIIRLIMVDTMHPYFMEVIVLARITTREIMQQEHLLTTVNKPQKRL